MIAEPGATGVCRSSSEVGKDTMNNALEYSMHCRVLRGRRCAQSEICASMDNQATRSLLNRTGSMFHRQNNTLRADLSDAASCHLVHSSTDLK